MLKILQYEYFFIVNKYLEMKIILEPILKFIESTFSNKRKVKISNKECLYWAVKVLTTGVPWNHITPNQCHYSTVYKRFKQWTTEHVFFNLWKQLVIDYQDKMLKIDSQWFKNLIIDSSMIKNIQGSDCIGKNHFDRNRLATKVSLIIDKQSIPLSCSFYPANQHDATTIDSSIKNVIGRIKRRKSKLIHNVIGDMGYIVNKQNKVRKINQHGINMVTPHRKNQKNKITTKDKMLLQSRYIIENVFCRLKKFNRVAFRRDKSITSFKSFFYLGLVILTLKNTK